MRVSRLWSNRTLFILLASFIVLIALAGLTLRSQNKLLAWPQRIVMDVQNTVGGWIYRPVSQAVGVIRGIHNLHEMYVQNAQLKQEMQNYALVKSEYLDAKSENARLKRMVGFKNSVGSRYQLVAAQVVGRDPSQWNSEVTIDVGLRSGVQPNMAVISPNGALVGRVAVASDTSSKVVLITDTAVGDGVSARVQTGGRNQPYGIVVGSSQQSGDLELDFLSPLAQVAKGDNVVTSGLSSIFPSGFLIGQVVSVHQGLQGVTQSATVKPTADLGYLQDVWVVLAHSNTAVSGIHP